MKEVLEAEGEVRNAVWTAADVGLRGTLLHVLLLSCPHLSLQLGAQRMLDVC